MSNKLRVEKLEEKHTGYDIRNSTNRTIQKILADIDSGVIQVSDEPFSLADIHRQLRGK